MSSFPNYIQTIGIPQPIISVNVRAFEKIKYKLADLRGLIKGPKCAQYKDHSSCLKEPDRGLSKGVPSYVHMYKHGVFLFRAIKTAGYFSSIGTFILKWLLPQMGE